MIAAVDPKLAWYVSRSAGLTCWVLCGVSIVWGLGLSTKLVRRRGLPAWLLDLHSFLGTLALVFVGVHIAGLVGDNYTHWGWREVLVPFASKWKPGPTAWGIVAFYLLIAIQVTSWMRKHLSKRVWHTIHLSSYGLFVAGTVHGIQAGTDWSNLLVKVGAGVVTFMVVWWTVIRLLRRAGKIEPIAIPPRGAAQRPAPLPRAAAPARAASSRERAAAAREAMASAKQGSVAPEDGDAGVGAASDHV